MSLEDAERFTVESLADWHDWLAGHHQRPEGVWVVTWRSSTGRPRVDYDALIREALCWGWIDGQARPLDQDRSMLWFTRRRTNSPWSGSNKARVADLEREGRLQPSGLAEIERAKANGMWTVLDSVEALIEPDDLAEALAGNPSAREHWISFPRGVKKLALGSIALAKRPQTRADRIATIVARAARGERPA